MIWTEVTPCTPGGAQWEAYPNDKHAIDIWPHEKEGFSWCVITDDVDDNAPEGWSATAEDAKRHAEQAYLEWLDVTEGRKPIPDQWLDAHDETAEIVAAAVAQERAEIERLHGVIAGLRLMVDGLEASAHEERAAVVAWLKNDHPTRSVLQTLHAVHFARSIERGEHRREEGA